MMCSLSDLLVESRTGYWGTDPENSDGSAFVVRNGDLQTSGIRWDDLPLRGLTQKELDLARLQKGDLLITTSGNCGVIGHIDEPPSCDVIASNFVRILRLDQTKALPRFLFYILRYNPVQQVMQSFTRGTTLKNLSFSKAAPKIQIHLPPLDEQKQIAEILDAAGALRAKRREALDRLDDLLQATFLDLFGDPFINPKCPVGRLGDHLTFVTSGGRGWAKYYCDRGARFVRSLDVQMNSISSEEEIFVDPPENAEAKRTRVKADDVLLTITGSRIGRVARAPETLEGAFISQHVAILRLGDQLMPEFVARFLSLEGGGQIQIGKLQYGQTKPGLNFRQIRSFQVPIPAIEEQQRFAEIVSSVEEQKAKMRKQLEQLDDLFASLQQRAFRGDL